MRSGSPSPAKGLSPSRDQSNIMGRRIGGNRTVLKTAIDQKDQTLPPINPR